MKWIGQHIWDFISRFRSDVYLDNISSGTIASGGNLGLDSNNKIVKATDSAPDADASTKGIVELATTAETTTGTDATRAVTPDGLKDGYQGSTNITTLGTITTGIWVGTKVSSVFANTGGRRYGNILKLIPSDFVTNDDGGVTKFGIGYVDTAGSTYGMKPTNANTELYAFVSIPEGMRATHVDIYDKTNLGVIVYELEIDDTTMTSKGTGNCNTTIDITDVNSTSTNFLAIQVTTTATSDRVFGGKVTIEAIPL